MKERRRADQNVFFLAVAYSTPTQFVSYSHLMELKTADEEGESEYNRQDGKLSMRR